MGFPPGYRFAVRVAHPGTMTGDHPRRDRSRRASLPWRFPVGRDNGTRSHLHMASARLSYLTTAPMSDTKRMRRCLLVFPRRARGSHSGTRVDRSLSTGACPWPFLSTGVSKQLDGKACISDAVVMDLQRSSRVRVAAASLIFTIAVALFAADALPASATPHDERWQWPTGEPVPIVEGFAPPAHDWLSGRRGVTLEYPVGLPVYACAPGTVTVAGPVAGRGVISIRHSVRGRDIWSTYLPVTPAVTVGDHVNKGDVIGVVEADSQTLHWGAKTGRRTYIDPIRLTIGRPRLLPWDEASAQ